MAKDVTQRFNIEASRAIRSVENLTQSIKSHNKEINASTKANERLNKSSSQLRAEIGQLPRQFGALSKGVDSTRQRLTELRGEFRNQQRSTARLTEDIRNLRESVKQTDRAFKEARAGAERLDARLRIAASAVQRFTDSLRKEAVELRNTIKEMRNYSSQVTNVTSRMKSKNRELGEQTIKTRADAQAVGFLTNQTRSLIPTINQETRALRRKNAELLKAIQLAFLSGRGRSVPLLEGPRTRVETIDIRENQRSAQSMRLLAGQTSQLTKESTKKNRAIREQGRRFREERPQIDRTTESTRGLRLAAFELRVAIGVLLARAIGALVNQLRDSVDGAKELSKRIAEVQTVSLEYRNGALQSAKAVAEWRGELLALSRNMGIPVLETTEALYNALSDQVVQAGRATNFLAQEMKLAITTVSTLDDAVKTTDTVINAFRKDISETAKINAILFRAVDVGRFRLDELGSQFGRVSVLSNQLGISFEEQAGSIALLTRLGLQADVAQTLLTNVQLKLIKPTETMNKLFAEWGVTSGQAAIQTFGFTEVIRKLAERADSSGDSMAELGEIFQDLRAITGATGLVGNFDKLEETIRDVSTATEHYNKAFDLSLDATGRKAEIELEKIRQLFLVRFGEPFLEFMLGIADRAGGADKAIAKLIGTVLFAGRIYASYLIAVNAVNAALAFHQGLTTKATVATVANTAAVNANRVALLSMTAAQATATLGLTALVAVIGELIAESATMQARLEAGLLSLRADLIERSRVELEKTQLALSKTSDAAIKFSNDTFRAYFLFAANIRATNTALTEDFEKKFKKIKDIMEKGLDVKVDVLTDRLRELRKEAEDARRELEKASESLLKLKIEEDDKRFAAGISSKTDEEALLSVIERRRKLETEALDALKRGDRDLADELFKRVEDLAEDASKRIDDLKDKVKDAAIEVKSHLDTLGRAGVAVTEDGITRSVRRIPPSVRRTRRLPGVRATVRPGGVVAGIDRKEEIVDLEKIEALNARLKALEDERARGAAERLRIEAEIIRRKEEEEKRLKAEIEGREKSLEAFKRLVAEIDAFDIKQPDAAGKFNDLLGRADKAGKAAGLTGAEQIQFLRQAFAQRLLLARQAATEAAKQQLDIEKRALDEGTRLVDEAVKRRQALANEAHENIETFANQNIEIAERLRTEFERPGFFEIGEIVGGFNKADRDRFERLKQSILDSISAFDLYNNKLLELRREGKDVSEVISLIRAEQGRLNFLLNEANKNKFAGRVGFGPVGGGVERNERGEILFERKRGASRESLSEQIRKSQEALVHLSTQFRDAAKAQAEMNAATETLKRVRDAASRIPPEIRRQAEEAERSGRATVTAQEAVNRVLEGTLDRLEAIRQQHLRIIEMQRREAAALEAAGPVVPRAHGGFVGQGTDRHLVALSGGETIMNRLATRQYAPILNALNGARPIFRAQGGDVTHNYGDIHVHPASTTADGIVHEVVKKLNRMQRRGLYSPRG